ncbi:MAG: hypothetical protein ACXVPQ_07730 [Bacteroidia bacterium]
MRFKFLIIPSVLIVQAAVAQTHSSYLATGEGTPTTTVEAAAPVADQAHTLTSSVPGETAIMDYKSVYESATTEEEVKMATDRFNLTKSQQEIWLTAAADRREAEKKAREQLESKDPNYSRDAVYKGLKSSQNTFYETIIGYLSPTQKQALETDREILEEKRKRVAKLPPPPPPAPTVTVAPVDSTAIKAAEKAKIQNKKTRKKKKTVGA